MGAFPSERKSALLQEIGARRADAHERLSGAKDVAEAFGGFHREGFVLIDLRRENDSVRSVWYRRADPLLVAGRPRPEIALLVQNEKPGTAGELQTWWL